MKLAIVAAHRDQHGLVKPDTMPLISGTIGSLLEQAKWAAYNGHDVTWIGNCEDGVWEGVVFMSSVKEAIAQTYDIAIFHSLSVIPKFPATVKVVDSQLYEKPVMDGMDAVQAHAMYQAAYFESMYDIPDTKTWVIPNGYDNKLFYPAPARVHNERKIFLYTSSPDRGLWHLFPILDKLDTPFELHVFYDVDTVIAQHWWDSDAYGLNMRKVHEGLKRPYVTVHGPVRRTELAEWYRAADMLLYPCDPIRLTEVCCTSLIEAVACGCVPLTTNADSLPSMFATSVPMLPLPINTETWRDAITELYGDRGDHYRVKGLKEMKKYRWFNIAPKWERMYTDLLEQKLASSAKV